MSRLRYFQPHLYVFDLTPPTDSSGRIPVGQFDKGSIVLKVSECSPDYQSGGSIGFDRTAPIVACSGTEI